MRPPKQITTHTLQRKADAGEKLTMLTAYDYPTAYFLDQCGIDVLLVGDSLGNVVLGYQTTLPVTVAELLSRTRAVTRGTKRAMVVADMPFLSYQLDEREAIRTASRFVKEGRAHAVKLEGTASLAAIRKLVQIGIPVMGHLGFTPQSLHQLGGYRIQGKTKAAERRLYQEAKALAAAGCFALVLELVPDQVAKRITRAVEIPTFGIAAGPATDGQVLVLHDLLGFSPAPPPGFVKPYAQVGKVIQRAVRRFMKEVQRGAYPGPRSSGG